VCIKRENCKGLESILLGPYRVKEVSNCGNRVKLIDWGGEWLNIKRLKPCKRGEDVVNIKITKRIEPWVYIKIF
jgi:hypothetical protein